MTDLYADIARRGYAAVAKDTLGRKTDELATLRALVQELAEALETLLAGVNGRCVTVGDCNQARAALAKAKQVTP